MDKRVPWRQWPVPLALVASPASPGLALAVGALLAWSVPAATGRESRAWQKPVLQASVVLLGLAVDPVQVARSAGRGFALSLATLLAVFAAGLLFARLLRVPRRVAALVCSGTAICGGSAIAAAGSALEADEAEMGTALGAVFLLNAVALYLLPFLSRRLGLSDAAFGTWCGLAIHDLSSVVGAAAQAGPRALEAALATKLARTLWIAPVALALGAVLGPRGGTRRGKAAIPAFLVGFFALAAARWALPQLAVAAPAASWIARKGMVLALYLVGAGLTREALRRTGPRVLVLAVLLWGLVLGGSLAAVR